MIKTLFGLIFVALATFTATISYAQTTDSQRKERKELAKASKKELGEKASKTARKEAKRLSKGSSDISRNTSLVKSKET